MSKLWSSKNNAIIVTKVYDHTHLAGIGKCPSASPYYKALST